MCKLYTTSHLQQIVLLSRKKYWLIEGAKYTSVSVSDERIKYKNILLSVLNALKKGQYQTHMRTKQYPNKMRIINLTSE